MSLFSKKDFSLRKHSALIVVLFTGILFLTILFLHQCAKGEDARFDDYTDSLFRQEVSGNAITLHYTLKDPSAYRIHDTPTSLGQVSTDTVAMGAAAENALARLHTFDSSALSEENKLIYDLLEETFSSACKMAPFALYEEPLSPLTGTQAQLPILLSEYPFYTLEDVETYLALLKEVPPYFQAILEFEQAKAAAGLFMTARRAEAVIKECEAFIAMGDEHYLHATFEERLREMETDLTEAAGAEEAASDLVVAAASARARAASFGDLVEKNARYIEEYVYPAYESLMKGLSELLATCENDGGLCHFPNGKEYYELLVRNMTGSDRTVLELEALTTRQITADVAAMQEVLEEAGDWGASELDGNDSGETGDGVNDANELAGSDDWGTSEFVLADSNPTSILTTLKEKLADDFPTPPPVNISVKYVDESMEDFLSPAFYLIPAIDNSKENVIYINPQHMNDDLTLFTTLAHEGYPGHLYQTTYFQSLNPAPIRSLLGCGGYTEGWATYCEMISYYYAPVSKDEATLMQKNSSVMLGLYALADMGIHYEGWSLGDTVDFFAKYGIYDNKAVTEIYDLILGDPANYLKYYIGYLEFLELKKDAIDDWGEEFSQERFHREVLELGDVPFWMIRERMLE